MPGAEIKQRFGNRSAVGDALRIQTLSGVGSQSTSIGTVPDHGALLGIADDDHTQYVHNTVARTISAVHTFNPGSATAPFILHANAQGQTVTGLKADQLNKSVIAGAGLITGGALTSDVTVAVGAGTGITVNADDVAINQSFTPTWLGAHVWSSTATFNGATTLSSTVNVSGTFSSHLRPTTTDTYDIGTSLLLWRKAYISELDAVMFAQNVITAIGGWVYISKGEGVLETDLGDGAGDVTAALGTTAGIVAHATTGDIIVFRAFGVVEYMKVTAGSGPTWTVTRDLDGSGRNAWPAGSVFVNLGYNNGRVELNATDTPRVSIVKQGTTYNATTEVSRLGDLNGWGDYVAENYGIALGEYAASKPNVTWDATNGLRFRVHNTTYIQFDVSGNAAFTNKLQMSGASAAIAIGSTPPTSASAGTGIWLDRTGLYGLLSNTVQAKLDAATGAITAGAGNVTLTANGLQMAHSLTATAQAKWVSSSTTRSYIESGLSGSVNFINIVALTQGGYSASSSVYIQGDLLTLSQAAASVTVAISSSGINLTGNTRVISGGLNVGTPSSLSTGDIRTSGGLYSGRDADPGDGNVAYSGALKSYKNSTEYTGYIFVPLETPLTCTSFDGDAFSDTAKTLITMTNASGSGGFGAPDNIKAVLMYVACRDSGSAANDTYLILGPNNTALEGVAISPMPVNDRYGRGVLIVPCNSGGDIYYQIEASGAGTFDLVMQVRGYWI